MKVFQIWIGGQLPSYLLPFVSSIKERSGENYLFIDDLLATEWVEKMSKALRDRYNEMQTLSGKSSILRMFILSSNPNSIYLDCDVELIEDIIPKGERICFGCFKNRADDFLIIGNNDKKKY